MKPVILYETCWSNENEMLFFDLLFHHQNQQRPYMECSPILQASSVYKVNDMIKRNYFGHVSPNGEYPNEIIQKLGYHFPYKSKANYIESLMMKTNDPQVALDTLLEDEQNKEHLFGRNSFFREFTQVGVSVRNGIWVVHIA